MTGWWNGNNSCRLPYIFLGLVLGAGPIINTHTNAVSIISLYPIPSERPSKVYLEKMMNFLSKELLTCFVGGVMRFYHRFHVILAFTHTAYGSSITYPSIYTYLPTYMLFGTKINDFSKRIILYKSFVYPKQKRQKCFSKWDVPLLTKYMT